MSCVLMFMEEYRDSKKLRQNLVEEYPLDSPLCLSSVMVNNFIAVT